VFPRQETGNRQPTPSPRRNDAARSMEKIRMATCQWCNTNDTLRKCDKCGNVWHCSKKPGRKGVSINVCEQCRAVDKFSLIR
jgi:hypothetical protein